MAPGPLLSLFQKKDEEPKADDKKKEGEGEKKEDEPPKTPTPIKTPTGADLDKLFADFDLEEEVAEPEETKVEEEKPKEEAKPTNLAEALPGALSDKLPEGFAEKLSAIPLPPMGEDSAIGKLGGFINTGLKDPKAQMAQEGFTKGKSFLFGMV